MAICPTPYPQEDAVNEVVTGYFDFREVSPIWPELVHGLWLEDIFPILLHPTLEEITLVGCDICCTPKTQKLLESYKHSTSLSRLRLIENDSWDTVEKIIIDLPRALQGLAVEYHGKRTLPALDAHRHSLRDLLIYQLNGDFIDLVFVASLDLSNLTSLEILTLRCGSEDPECDECDDFDCGDHRQHMQMLKGLPPQLSTLCFENVPCRRDLSRYMTYLRCIGSDLCGHGLQSLENLVVRFRSPKRFYDPDLGQEHPIPTHELESVGKIYLLCQGIPSPTRAKPTHLLTLREGTLLFSSVQSLYVAEL
jgi:hypothetical protein